MTFWVTERKTNKIMVTNINELLGYTLDNNASDLHLSVGSVPMVRIHGEMQKLQLPVLDQEVMKKIMLEVLNDNQQKRFLDNLEIDFSAKLQDRGRFRVNFFHQLNGYSAVFRAIPTVVLSSEELAGFVTGAILPVDGGYLVYP